MGSRRACLLTLACTGTLALGAAPAPGAQVSESGGLLLVGPKTTEVVSVNVTQVAHSGATNGYYQVADNFAPVSIGSGTDCVSIGMMVAHCDPTGLNSVLAVLSDSPDSFALNAPLQLVLAGEGGGDAINGGPLDDTIVGGPGDDIVDGAGGDDRLSDTGGFGAGPSGGNDQYLGGAGNDDLDGGATANPADSGTGHDLLDGGANQDTVDYSQRTRPLTITVGETGAATTGNDGEAGEGDNVLNVETVIGGSAADAITADSQPSTLDGRTGDDTLTGGAGADHLYGYDAAGPAPGGADGDDTLNGSDGNDELFGQAGDDTLDGGAGADTLSGGDGVDTATYAARVNSVSVTLNGLADDGEAGEGDNALDDIEAIVGGAGADVLTGNGAANALSGAGGDDTLTGAGGDDTLTGGDGDDTIHGSSGDDTIDGGAGNDTLDGGTGADAITCGAGDDTVIADAADTVAADCEHVTLPAGSGGGGPGGGGAGAGGGAGGGGARGATAPNAGLPKTISLVAQRTLRLTVTCPVGAAGGCGHGTLTITFQPRTPKHRRKPRSIRRSASFTLAAGDRTTLSLTLSAAQRAAIKGVTRVTVSVTDRDVAGVRGSARATLRLRAVKR